MTCLRNEGWCRTKQGSKPHAPALFLLSMDFDVLRAAGSASDSMVLIIGHAMAINHGPKTLIWPRCSQILDDIPDQGHFPLLSNL